MKYDLSQLELQKAIEYYLNEKVLKTPIKVDSVSPIDTKARGIHYVLHVEITDDQLHINETN